jgi:hypothetical protein
VVVTITKFTHGAWLVFIMMPVLFLLMMGVNRYYRDVAREVEVDPTTTFGASGDHAIVLVGKMQKPVLKALDYAIAARHQSIEAVHISVDEDATELLQQQWHDMNIHVALTIIESPYRDFGIPLIKYIKHRREEHGSEVTTVYLPQYIVGHWWESFLHNHRARRISKQLMMLHGVTIALVPWLLDSSELVYGRRSRPLPGQDRRGEPIRAIPRRPLAPAAPTAAGRGRRGGSAASGGSFGSGAGGSSAGGSGAGGSGSTPTGSGSTGTGPTGTGSTSTRPTGTHSTGTESTSSANGSATPGNGAAPGETAPKDPRDTSTHAARR